MRAGRHALSRRANPKRLVKMEGFCDFDDFGRCADMNAVRGRETTEGVGLYENVLPEPSAIRKV
eukprot:179549-Chlamydomonas_euryale.AAC.5